MEITIALPELTQAINNLADALRVASEPRQTENEVPQKAEAGPAEPQQEEPVKPTDEPPALTEDYRIEVRRVLADLNKIYKGNPAKKLIPQVTGFNRLTEVPLEKLPELMEAARNYAE